MKTALDALMEALETDTWTPPVGSGIGAPKSFHASPRASTAATLQGKAPHAACPGIEEATPDDNPVNSSATCGSATCAGCYVVDSQTGARIHPPKCGNA